jgi:hypothetical protein
VLLLFTSGFLLSQIPVCLGLEKTYHWDHSLYGEVNTYEASLTTADRWQVDSAVNITVRFVLVAKGTPLNYTEPVSLLIRIQGTFFIMENKPAIVGRTLMNAGDYWEESVSFHIPAANVGRGQLDNVSIVFRLRYNEKDSLAGKFWQTTYGPTYDEAMYVSMLRPFLSTWELTIIVILAILACGPLGFLIYERRSKRDSIRADENERLVKRSLL